jgi:hypothetical protein
MNNKNLDTIKMIEDLYSVTNIFHAKAYIWGGLVQDILEKKLLREHRDIDVFIEDLVEHLSEITNSMEKMKYQCKYNEEINMLVIYKNEKHFGINPLKINHDIAIWKHIGEKGFVVFPKEWLDEKERQFFDINVLTSGIKFEYSFRKIATHLNPQWKEREKDKIALEYYEQKIIENNIDKKELLKNIWSYNPFWLDYGYNGFMEPILVLGKECI